MLRNTGSDIIPPNIVIGPKPGAKGKVVSAGLLRSLSHRAGRAASLPQGLAQNTRRALETTSGALRDPRQKLEARRQNPEVRSQKSEGRSPRASRLEPHAQSGCRAPSSPRRAPPRVRRAPLSPHRAPPRSNLAPFSVIPAPPSSDLAPFSVAISPPRSNLAPFSVIPAPPSSNLAPFSAVISSPRPNQAPFSAAISPPRSNVAPFSGILAAPRGHEVIGKAKMGVLLAAPGGSLLPPGSSLSGRDARPGDGVGRWGLPGGESGCGARRWWRLAAVVSAELLGPVFRVAPARGRGFRAGHGGRGVHRRLAPDGPGPGEDLRLCTA
jgi:hypothetical protein